MHSHNLVLLKNEYFEGCNIIVIMSIVIATSIIVIIFLVVVSLIKTKSYFEGYDKTVNPTAASAFTTSAFRFLI